MREMNQPKCLNRPHSCLPILSSGEELYKLSAFVLPGRVAQSVASLTYEPEVPGSIPGPATHLRFPFADSRRTVFSYWRNYVHLVLVNRLGGLSLPWNCINVFCF